MRSTPRRRRCRPVDTARPGDNSGAIAGPSWSLSSSCQRWPRRWTHDIVDPRRAGRTGRGTGRRTFGRPRTCCAGSQLALPVWGIRSDCSRRLGAHPAVRRSQDPHVRRVRRISAGRHRQQGAPAAATGGVVAGRTERQLDGHSYRRHRRADRPPCRTRNHAPGRCRLMALGRAFSVAVQGVAGDLVEIEADITSGLPGVHLVGLPDAALQESRDRVRAAIMNCGNRWPMSRLTLARSPATLPKMGAVYALALAAAVLSADRKVRPGRLEKAVLLGELALDGRVRPVRGVLPAVVAAKREGWQAVVVPVGNLTEAALVDGIDVYGAGSLRQVQSWLDGAGELGCSAGTDAVDVDEGPDLADVVGQPQARFAVEVAAAGGDHLLLTRPPG